MLATVAAGVPLQANFRRAVSAAYYALFHLLIAESTTLLVPGSPTGLRARVARSFAHSDMKKVCERFEKPQMSEEYRALCPQGATPQLRTIAATFRILQEVRHRADYEIGYTMSRAVALSRVEDAERAFQLFTAIGPTDERAVFLTALASAARGSK